MLEICRDSKPYVTLQNINSKFEMISDSEIKLNVSIIVHLRLDGCFS